MTKGATLCVTVVRLSDSVSRCEIMIMSKGVEVSVIVWLCPVSQQLMCGCVCLTLTICAAPSV